MIAYVGYSMAGTIERSGGVVCGLHVETMSACLLVEPQNQGRWFLICLASKPLGRFLIDLCLKIDGDGLSVV
jgi:hypothetical protein